MDSNERMTIEQNLHSLAVQRQAVQQQLSESEVALKELQGATTAYRIVGGLMVQAPVGELTEELQKKKEASQARLQMIEKQQERLKSKLESK